MPELPYAKISYPPRRTSFVTGISIESSSVTLIVGSLPGSIWQLGGVQLYLGGFGMWRLLDTL